MKMVLVKWKFAFDASELMDMVGDEMKKDGEKKVDSIIDFKEFLYEKRDSISQLSAEDQAKLKSLEPFKMHMLMDPETSEMKFELLTDFNSVGELQDMFKAMNSVSNMGGQGAAKVNDPNNPFSALGQNGSTEMSYAFDGKIFTRTAKLIDKETYSQMVDSLDQMAMMFSTSKYKLNYHFPKPIKIGFKRKCAF